MSLSGQSVHLGDRGQVACASVAQFGVGQHDQVRVKHSDELLFCEGVLPRTALSGRRITNEVLQSVEPLVHKLAEFYQVPIPTLELKNPTKANRGEGWYCPFEHVIGFTSDNSARELPSILFHEFNHIWQYKVIIAAQLGDPKTNDLLKKASQRFFEPMVEAVKSQHLAENEAVVELGRKCARSHLDLCAAKRIEQSTDDPDEYLAMRAVYRRSLCELMASIPEIDVNVWLNERDLAESSHELQRLREERLRLPMWSLLAVAGNRFATWVAQRRCLKLTQEVQTLVEKLRDKLDEATDRLGHEIIDATWSGSPVVSGPGDKQF